MRFPIDTHHTPKTGSLNVLPGHSQKDPDAELAPVAVAKAKAGGAGSVSVRPKNVNSDSPVRDALHTSDGSGEVYTKHWAQAVKEHPALVDPKVIASANELADKILDAKHKFTPAQAEAFMAKHPELKELLSKPSIDLIFKAHKSDSLAKALADFDPKHAATAHENADFLVSHPDEMVKVANLLKK
jgi:hypothetical protein